MCVCGVGSGCAAFFSPIAHPHPPPPPHNRALRTAVIAGTVTPDFAYLNAALIPGLRGLALAAFAARAAATRGRARTRSPCTELVLALSGGRNIGTALATFGLSDQAKHLVVCRFDAGEGDGDAAVAAVQGTLVPLDELASVRDEAAMTKVRWWVGEDGWGVARAAGGCVARASDSHPPPSPPSLSPQAFHIGDTEVGPLDDAAVCRMAAREC